MTQTPLATPFLPGGKIIPAALLGWVTDPRSELQQVADFYSGADAKYVRLHWDFCDWDDGLKHNTQTISSGPLHLTISSINPHPTQRLPRTLTLLIGQTPVVGERRTFTFDNETDIVLEDVTGRELSAERDWLTANTPYYEIWAILTGSMAVIRFPSATEAIHFKMWLS